MWEPFRCWHYDGVSYVDCVSRVCSHYSYVLFKFHFCNIRSTPQCNILFCKNQENWLEVECSYFSIVSQPQNVLILLLFKICIICHMGINFQENYFSRKNLQIFFFIIFVKINFRQETYFPYFARIKFSGFHKKDILRIAVTFCMRLKKAFTRLARDLIRTIQKFKFFS